MIDGLKFARHANVVSSVRGRHSERSEESLLMLCQLCNVAVILNEVKDLAG